MQVFFLRFLHKTYNADDTWIDKRIRRTVEEENEQTANEKESDYNHHTQREGEKKRRKR